MPISSRIKQLAITRLKVQCYVRWLQLKIDEEYLLASEKIRSLMEAARRADDCLAKAHAAYIPLLKQPNPDSSKEKRIAQQEYWSTQELATKVRQDLSEEMEKVCGRFDLAQWWPPEDASITVDDADCIFHPSPPVLVIPPPPEKQMDLNVEADKKQRRTLQREGTAVEPPRRYTMADKEGWITLKVNLGAPLEELEQAIGQILRINRWNPPKNRLRPDKDAEALKVWACYDQAKQFSLVAKQLKRKVTTVRGQYIKACTLIYGQKPSGSIKQRRAGTLRNPAAEYQAHQRSCSHCQKANTLEKMCSTYRVFATQDTKTLRERLQ